MFSRLLNRANNFKKNLLVKGIEVKVLATQSCLALCDTMDCSLPSSFVHGILQARILEWTAIPFSRGSSWTRVRTWVSPTAGRFFTELPGKPKRDAGTKYFKKLRRGRRRNTYIVLLGWYHKLFTMSRRKFIYRKSRGIHRSQTQRVYPDSYQQPNMNRVMMLGNYIHNHIGRTSADSSYTFHIYHTLHFLPRLLLFSF